MNQKQRDQVIATLLAFLERATQKDATPEEVQALPKVAELLLNYVPIFAQDRTGSH